MTTECEVPGQELLYHPPQFVSFLSPRPSLPSLEEAASPRRRASLIAPGPSTSNLENRCNLSRKRGTVRAQPGKGPAPSQKLPVAQVELEAGHLDQQACDGVARALASLSHWPGRLTGNPRCPPQLPPQLHVVFCCCFSIIIIPLSPSSLLVYMNAGTRDQL